MKVSDWGSSRCFVIGVCLMVLFIATFSSLGSIGLRAEEPRRAVVAMEALLDGNYLVPKIHGRPYYNKPPLYNWILAGSFKVTGSLEEWAVRLPGAISIWITALLIFLVGRRQLGDSQSIVAVLMYLTAADLIFYGAINSGEIDLFYSMVVVVQALSVYHFFNKKKYVLLFIVSYILTAAGFLTKGFPSVAFQALTLLGVFVWYRSFWKLFSWQHAVGILCLASIISFYFFEYGKQADAVAFAINLFKESSQRSINEASVWDILLHIPLFPLKLMSLLLPWSLFLLILYRKKPLIAGKPILKFALLFVVANIPLYWLSPDIRNRYLYMFFPFFALLLSQCYAETQRQNGSAKWVKWLFFVLSLISGLFFAILPLMKNLVGTTPNIWLKGLSLCGLLLIVSYLILSKPKHSFYFFVISLGLVRIGYNVCLIPHINQSSKAAYYQGQVTVIQNLSSGAPILWTGYPSRSSPAIQLLGLDIVRSQLEIPPLLAYEIPYYYTVSSGLLLKYDADLVKNKFYLGSLQFANDHHAQILYIFHDKWTTVDLALYTLK